MAAPASEAPMDKVWMDAAPMDAAPMDAPMLSAIRTPNPELKGAMRHEASAAALR